MFGFLFWIRIFLISIICTILFYGLTNNIIESLMIVAIIDSIKIGIEYLKFKDEAKRLRKLEQEINKKK